ncbi:hypothetical protein WUBG_06482, partial [Wuchereria bancrofti]
PQLKQLRLNKRSHLKRRHCTLSVVNHLRAYIQVLYTTKHLNYPMPSTKSDDFSALIFH